MMEDLEACCNVFFLNHRQRDCASYQIMQPETLVTKNVWMITILLILLFTWFHRF